MQSSRERYNGNLSDVLEAAVSNKYADFPHSVSPDWAGVCLVSESGIRSRADVERLMAGGVKAVLVGETLMRADDIGRKLDDLRGQGNRQD